MEIKHKHSDINSRVVKKVGDLGAGVIKQGLVQKHGCITKANSLRDYSCSGGMWTTVCEALKVWMLQKRKQKCKNSFHHRTLGTRSWMSI